ncbi:hypothetical protein ACWC2M_18530 [Streptomyces sp. NPDC001761]
MASARAEGVGRRVGRRRLDAGVVERLIHDTRGNPYMTPEQWETIGRLVDWLDRAGERP